MRVVNVRDFDIPSDENDYDELVAFADTMASIEQFDAYTKDEVIAILTELQLEIEENGIVDFEETYVDDGECIISVSECNRLIQQKIDKLKEGKEE